MTQHRKRLSIIKRLSPTAFVFDPMSKEDFIDIADTCGAYWMHSGDLAEPHAMLMTGLCSNGYLNMMKVLQYPNLSQILARQIINTLPTDIDLGRVDWILGSAYTATGLSKDIANLLGKQWVPLQKNSYGKQICGHAYFTQEETILHVEDVFTTGKSLLSVREAIRQVQPIINILHPVPVIVFRPSCSNSSETLAPIVLHPLFQFNEFWVTQQNECTLCQQGSKPLKPKANWSLFSNAQGDNRCTGQ